MDASLVTSKYGYLFSSTVYYEGGWVDGKRHGQGIFRSEDGSVYNVSSHVLLLVFKEPQYM